MGNWNWMWKPSYEDSGNENDSFYGCQFNNKRSFIAERVPLEYVNAPATSIGNDFLLTMGKRLSGQLGVKGRTGKCVIMTLLREAYITESQHSMKLLC